jgi:hypothetical protein
MWPSRWHRRYLIRICPHHRRRRLPPMATDRDRESTGLRRRAAPSTHSRFAAINRRETSPCRARPRRNIGGCRHGTTPATSSRRPAATGSYGSTRAATRWRPPRRRPGRSRRYLTPCVSGNRARAKTRRSHRADEVGYQSGFGNSLKTSRSARPQRVRIILKYSLSKSMLM